MAAAPRTRPAPVTGKTRAAAPAAPAVVSGGALQTWGVPGVATLVVAVAAGLEALELIPQSGGVAVSAFALLVLLLSISLRPLFHADVPSRERAAGLALGAVWLIACYVPFHTRLFPGTPIVNGASLSASGAELPLVIPASGHRAIDLVLTGQLETNPTGGTALPVSYVLTVEGQDGAPAVVQGRFDDELKTQRLGRRGTTTVHQMHQAEVHVLGNPGGGDLRITRVSLEPESAHPLAVTAYVHPLPGPIVLAMLALALLAAVVALDRLSALNAADGVFTIATASTLGAAVVFWTSNTVAPDFRTLVGSAIFGGPLGFAGGALIWWVAKRVVAAPEH